MILIYPSKEYVMNVNKKDKIIALAGNPNSGKTTLFNSLTGARQTVGNWPGVTVEKKSGIMEIDNESYEIVDLPGIYSLTAYSIDEEVARNFIINESPDLIINIVDATNLERNLYLTTQLLQFRKPMIVCLNMMDLAEKQGLKIDIVQLAHFLDCPVLPISAFKKTGLDDVKKHIICSDKSAYTSLTKIPYDEVILKEIKTLSPDVKNLAEKYSLEADWLALKMIENDPIVLKEISAEERNVVLQSRERIHKHTGMQAEIMTADGRYAFIKGICREILKKNQAEKTSYSDKIDKFLLHPLVGLPVFSLVMYLMFTISITLSGPFIDFFDIFFGGIFVDGFKVILEALNLPFWLTTFLADGVGGGLQTVSTFIPPIFFIFLVLSFLEDSGYMARVAFTMDKFMHWLGLSGKSIIPMVVGFGCTVPAIMATRTLENKRDRMMTIMLVPFISCGAKIPVYVMFAVYFFPKNAGLIIFALYLTGILLALVTGQIIKRIAFKGQAGDFVMELPTYHVPTLNGVFMHTWHRLKDFILRAGKTIIFVIILLTMINALPIRENPETGNKDTILNVIGQTITPIFTPMGIDQDNWPATVALFTGLFAKEAIVGSFEALYSDLALGIERETDEMEEEDEGWSFTAILSEASEELFGGLGSAFSSIINPFAEGDEEDEFDDNMLKEHQKRFKNIHQVIAYLLFILVYAPCVAAIAAAQKEAGTRFAIVQVIYLTFLAWVVSTVYYNLLVFTAMSFVWFSVSALIMAGIVMMFKKIDLLNN